MGDVIKFDGKTTQDLDPKEMLSALAGETDIEHVLVVAYREDGTLSYHSSNANVAEVNMWIDMFKHDVVVNPDFRED